MGYSIKREHVTHNLKLLKAINEKVSNGETFTLEPRNEAASSQVAYQIRNVLKSAESFPDYGFSHLASQVVISTKAHVVEIKPKYGFAKMSVLSDIGAIEKLMAESRDFVTLTFRLTGSLDEMLAALDEWEATNVRENPDDDTITVSFQRESADSTDSPFSILGQAESPDYDEYIQGLLDDAD